MQNDSERPQFLRSQSLKSPLDASSVQRWSRFSRRHPGSFLRSTQLQPLTFPYHRSYHTTQSPRSSPALPETLPNDDPEDGSTRIVPFLLADIGEGILEVELLQWFVNVGDVIHQFDRVCEVQSDKATVEITSRYDGVVVERTGGNVGDLVRVGQPLLRVRVAREGNDEPAAWRSGSDSESPPWDREDEGTWNMPPPSSEERLRIPSVGSQFHLSSDDDVLEKDDDYTELDASITRSQAATAYEASQATRDCEGKFQASPAVRKLGAEYKIDLTTIRPSGPGGRLLKSDVVTYLKEQGLWRGIEAAADQQTIPASGTDRSVTTASRPLEQKDEIIQLKGYNRLMVQTMTASLQIPHMGFADELILNHLLQCRQQLNQDGSSTNLSMLVFLTKAASLALTEVPTVNALVHSATDYEIQVKTDHNIGIAMDTPRGLVVPVLKQVQRKSLVELQNELNTLKELAAASQLKTEHLSDGTFTLSNIGSMGCGTYMQPVIVSPQLAMGAFGSIQTVPRFSKAMSTAANGGNDLKINAEELSVVAAKVLNVSWAGDHRFLDGATLARFHKVFKRFVENPVAMLANMR